jgi:glucosamine--fructose-6-phosphate aminotransferase (isomerizing)
MCGIVGYVGSGNATEVILAGLRRLEYRGYDSAGLAVVTDDRLHVRRRVGKIACLEAALAAEPVTGRSGLGHTRWATHGRPSEVNAHPHVDCEGRLALVHNGIIEDFQTLRESLLARGHHVRSETDTELLVHLLEEERRQTPPLLEALRRVLAGVRGSYAVAVLATDAPDTLVAAKHGAGSVVVGLMDDGAILASDIPAVLPHTRDVVILEDGDLVEIGPGGMRVVAADGRAVARRPEHITWDAAMARKNGYPHFMLKEIHEQPGAVSATRSAALGPATAELGLEASGLTPEVLAPVQRLAVVACGTSYHAALIGRAMIERLAGLPVEVDIASEFRYRDLALGGETLVVAISQSGETADTLGGAKVARGRQSPVLAITNVVGSALAREADGVVYTHAGPEIGVASTKTFTATLTACYLLAAALGRQRGYLSDAEARKAVDELEELPAGIAAALELGPACAGLARELGGASSVLFLGRGVQYPVALEGALKLKELSYVHAEGYAGGEMKHGPIALIDERLPVVTVVPRDASYERMLANLQEVRARGGQVLAVCHPGDERVGRLARWVLEIPVVPDLLSPLVTIVPLQLLAYHMAVERGLDVDQPRNLAKSVTVE